MKKVAVVILNWNGRKLLERFLPSITKYTPCENVEIIVADNCSSDSSIDFLTVYYPQVKQILLLENHGYAQGYNEALAQLDTEYVVLLNSDVEVTKGWIDPVIAYLDTHQDVAAVQPKILAQRNKTYFEYAGAAGGFMDKYGYPFCRGRIFGKLEQDLNQYNDPVDIFWASGACLFIRLAEYKEVGGFDPTFFAHMEEIDLCWRMNARGKRIVSFPESTVYHVGAATLSGENPHKTFLNFRNNLLMLYKNLPDKEIKKVLYIRIILDYIAAAQMIVSGKTRTSQAILKAHKEFKRTKNKYKHVRKENLSKTIQPSIKTIYPKSILWAFYIKGRKRFSDIKF